MKLFRTTTPGQNPTSAVWLAHKLTSVIWQRLWPFIESLGLEGCFSLHVFSRETFRRRVLLKIVGVYHTMHINKHHSTHIVSIRIHSIRISSIRIPSIRIPSIRIDSIRIYSIPIQVTRIHSIRMHQQEWQWMWIQNIPLHIIASAGMAMNIKSKSLHVISYHCYSAGMAIETKPCISLNFIAPLLIAYRCIARVWTCNSLLAIGLLACLLACLPFKLARLLLNYFLLLYSAGRDVPGLPEITTPSSKTWCRSRPGSLGNCWLVASFAAVAEFPCFIQNHVFATNQSSSSSYTGFGLWQPLKDTGDASSVKLGNHLQEIQENNFKPGCLMKFWVCLYFLSFSFEKQQNCLLCFFAAKHATDHLMTWILFSPFPINCSGSLKKANINFAFLIGPWRNGNPLLSLKFQVGEVGERVHFLLFLPRMLSGKVQIFLGQVHLRERAWNWMMFLHWPLLIQCCSPSETTVSIRERHFFSSSPFSLMFLLEGTDFSLVGWSGVLTI